ncbi:hypothetical protein ACOMHN_045167 [Nucella lapillus]
MQKWSSPTHYFFKQWTSHVQAVRKWALATNVRNAAVRLVEWRILYSFLLLFIHKDIKKETTIIHRFDVETQWQVSQLETEFLSHLLSQ